MFIISNTIITIYYMYGETSYCWEYRIYIYFIIYNYKDSVIIMC